MRCKPIKVLGILLLLIFSTYAQSQKIGCPSILLKPPSGLVQPDDKALVAVELTGGNVAHGSLSFDWYVSSGRITGGRGKQFVEILTDDENAGSIIKVAVFVRGLPTECSVLSFAEFSVASLPIGEPVDRVGKVGASRTAFYSFLSTLDAYIAQVVINPGYEGFVTVEFNKKDNLQHKIGHLQRMYRHFVFRKFDLSRITFALAEHEYPERTTFWTMHPKAKVPEYTRNYRIIKAENYRNRLNCIFPLD